MGLLAGVCVTYAVCAFVVAVLPNTAALSLAPLTLLTVAAALDSTSHRAWHVA
jgi:hypothetical protein